MRTGWSIAAVVLATGVLTHGCKPQRELIYVSAELSEQIVVIDPSRAEVVRRIPVGKRPRGLRLSLDEKLLYVAQSGSPRAGPGVDASKLPPADRAADGVGVIDLAAGARVRTLPGGQDPETFDLSRDGKYLYVSNEETAEMSVLDVSNGKILKRVPVGEEPEGVTVRPDGRRVYVTSEEEGTIVGVDTATLKPVASVMTGKRPRSIVFARDGRTAFVTNELDATVSVVDTDTHRVLQQIAIPGSEQLPARPMGAAVSPNGSQLYVSTGRGRAVAVIDVEKRELVRMIEGVGTRPWGIVISRDGKRLYTANGPSDDVSIIDLATAKVTHRIQVGGSPWGLTTGGQAR